MDRFGGEAARAGAQGLKVRGLSAGGDSLERTRLCNPIPWLLGKMQGSSLNSDVSPCGQQDKSRGYHLNSLATKQGIRQGLAEIGLSHQGGFSMQQGKWRPRSEPMVETPISSPGRLDRPKVFRDRACRVCFDVILALHGLLNAI